MAAGGALLHLVLAGGKALFGDSDEAYEEIDKASDALKRPPLAETGEAISDLLDDIFNSK